MNFEEMQEKLQQIKSEMGNMTEQELLKEFNDIYEKAIGEEALGEPLKDVINELKKSSKNSEKRGLKGFLTKEQIVELEGKANIVTKALEEAKELRENSEIDKIDEYVQSKIEGNEKQSKAYEDENTILKGQKTRLENVYKNYQSNQKAKKVADKITKLMDLMIEDMETYNDANASAGKKEKAKQSLEKNGKEALGLINEDSVKDNFIQRSTYFKAKVDEWKKEDIEEIRTKSMTVSSNHQSKARENEEIFNKRIEQVPINYENTPVETFLQDINKKYNKIEDKWVAIGGKINENEKKIQEIKGRNKTYEQYAKNVKERAEIEEKQQFSDEELDNYLRTEKNSDREIDGNEEVAQLATYIRNNGQNLAMIEAKDPKDMDRETVLQWKRRSYLEKHEKKAIKQLNRINKRIEKDNKKMRRYGIQPQEQATMEDLINNTEKVQDIRYFGKFMNNHRFGLRSRIPVLFKGRYSKECHQGLIENYKTIDEKLGKVYANKRQEIGNDIRERYKFEQEIKHSMAQQKEQDTMKEIYRSETTNEQER
ncbi:MAG: hypothetical protein HFJ34_07930 [Clostridia bacterium]|nr:hypothetical protein [Clostridia bacterium]